MEQRRLRLGDILDDYCPRERRVTNHAVVAMIEEDVKQTRCTTCDAEHVYKGGKAPRRKKSDATGALYKEVLASVTDKETAAAAIVPMTEPEREPELVEAAEPPLLNQEPPAPVEPIAARVAPDETDDTEEDGQIAFMDVIDEGPVHRPLIRAQLPRVEGLKPERQIPDFTMRQAGSRGGNGSFRGRQQHGGNGGGANRFGRGGGPNRNGGGRQGGGNNNRFDRGPRNKRGR
jgi:hypothetical protein